MTGTSLAVDGVPEIASYLDLSGSGAISFPADEQLLHCQTVPDQVPRHRRSDHGTV